MQKGRKSLKSKRHHHHHRPHRQYVQFNHDEDEDDLLTDKELQTVEQMNDEFVQFNHEGDTEDIDVEVPAETPIADMRGSARQRIAEDENWNNFFSKQGKVGDDEAEWDKTNVQLSDEFLPRKKGEPFLYENELVQEKAENKLQELSEEIQGIMDEQAHEDSMNVQLGYTHIPHADDTEDILDEDQEGTYDHHHSKEWNALVDKKAEELENFMKEEEQNKIKAKKAAEEAKRKAIEDKARQEAEKRKKAQELAQQKTKKVRIQTVDFNDIYSGITPDEITLQTAADVKYEHHSKFYNDQVEQQAAELEKTIAAEEQSENKSN